MFRNNAPSPPPNFKCGFCFMTDLELRNCHRSEFTKYLLYPSPYIANLVLEPIHKRALRIIGFFGHGE